MSAVSPTTHISCVRASESRLFKEKSSFFFALCNIQSWSKILACLHLFSWTWTGRPVLLQTKEIHFENQNIFSCSWFEGRNCGFIWTRSAGCQYFWPWQTVNRDIDVTQTSVPSSSALASFYSWILPPAVYQQHDIIHTPVESWAFTFSKVKPEINNPDLFHMNVLELRLILSFYMRKWPESVV